MTKRGLTYQDMARMLFDHFGLVRDAEAENELARLWERDNQKAKWLPGALETVRAVRQRGGIAVLVTNSTWSGWLAATKRLQLAREFDYLFASCEQGAAKPEATVWHAVESWFPDIMPAQFLMIGDSETNDLAIPRSRGWQTMGADSIGALTSAPKNNLVTVVVDTPVAGIDRLERFGVLLLDPVELSSRLANWEGWSNLDPSRTIVVVPGNGGSLIAPSVLARIAPAWKDRVVPIVAKRNWSPGSDPYAATTRIFPERMALGIKDVVVLDNVIASGVTVQTIYELNEPWIPGARWHALTWLAQRSSSVSGNISIMAGAWCSNKIRREPTGTTSTLSTDRERLRSFAARNFPHHAEEVSRIISGTD